jgi:hypothetical protein
MLEGGEIKDGCRKAAAGVVVAAVVSLCVCAGALASGDANSSECLPATEASSGFHTYLPDCRAYELVSPAFASGAVPFGTGNSKEPPPISATGEHLLSLVFGGFAETEALEQNLFKYGAYYEFSRTTAGWTAEALSPPDSLYPRFEFAFASTDFSRSLWSVEQAAAPGEELPIGVPPEDPNGVINGYNYPNNGTLVIREAIGGGKGRFTVVGPVTAPGHEPTSKVEGFEPAGASADLSHILLDVEATLKQLWPGDETTEGRRRQSLYEYVGTGDREPVLVGVRNEGHLDGKPYLNDDANLISRCGTVLGGSRAGGSLQDAVSAGGEIVYFTALACGEEPKVNELYARVDAEQTVDISEPSTGSGGDCAACDESEPASAAFHGASEDGSKVFFTSEQQLLPKAKGNTLYEYDFDAGDPHERLTVIAPEVGGVAGISEDGGRVYFESSAVLSVGANGNGEEPQLVGQNLYVYDTVAGGKPVFVAQDAGNERVTHDGTFLVFESSRHISGTNDTSVIPQLFEYDADTGVIARVSVGQSAPGGYECETTHVAEEGFNCDGNATSGSYQLPYSLAEGEGIKWAPTNPTSGLAVAKDGTVEFESAIALTPLAIPGKENVYEYRGGEVYLISPGSEEVSTDYEGGSRLLGIDESGQDVFFSTTEGLLPQDTDTQTSWYDARENGGFPRPLEASACAGSSCQGALTPTPVLPTPGGSATAVGGGNLAPLPAPVVKPKPAVKCKKGDVKKNGKCVKKPKAKKASARRASNNRRGES